jgi:hypothetical protein
MDIQEVKKPNEFDKGLKNIINKFKLGNNRIILNGSASLKSQKYFSDYDLFSPIENEIRSPKLYEDIKKILKYIDENPDLYFVELKIQNNLDQKYKYYKGDILNYDKFTKEIKNLNYLKIDLIYFFENRFIEISIIYQFDIIDFDEDNPKDIKKQIKLFQDDIKELKEDKKYFKILKRYFSINRLLKNNKKLLELNKILNSSSGALYQKKSNLEALKTVSENYKDELTQRKILVNLKELKIPANIKLIEKYIDDLQNTINKEVKKYIE